MIAKVYEGLLTEVNSDKGQIQIENANSGRLISLHIDDETRHIGWEQLVGRTVQAVVIDNTTTRIYEIEEP